MTTSGPVRPRRSDARQNAAAILDAARTIFACNGVDAPAKDITDLAGVGVGTLYRHFPLRSDLVAAVMTNEIDACADAAMSLASSDEPGDGLREWVRQYVDLVVTKRGFAAALNSDDPGLQGVGPHVRERLEPALQMLLDAARGADGSLAGITAGEVIVGVALLCQPVPHREPEFNQRLIDVFVDGLF